MLPQSLHRYFWDTTVTALDVRQHASYLIERLLEVGDLDAIRWVLAEYSAEQIITLIKRSRSLSPRSATFWALFFDLSPAEVPCIRQSWLTPRPTVSNN